MIAIIPPAMSVLCVLLFVSWLFWKGEIQRFETILKNCVYCRLKLNWRAINTLFLLYPFVILLTIVAVDIQRYIWTSYSCGIYTQQNRTQRGRYPATSDSWGVLIDTCNIKSDQGQIIPNHCSIFFFAHYICIHLWSFMSSFCNQPYPRWHWWFSIYHHPRKMSCPVCPRCVQ